MSVSVSVLKITLDDYARAALEAQRKINQLTEQCIDPAKLAFRDETKMVGKGFSHEVAGLGVVQTRAGSPGSTTETYVLNTDNISASQLQVLLKAGMVERKVSIRKPSEPSVVFKLNV